MPVCKTACSPGARSIRCARQMLAALLALPVLAGAAKAPNDWCARLASRLPGVSVASCQSSALLPSGAKSVQGFPILAREILPKMNTETPIRVLLLGGIHG